MRTSTALIRIRFPYEVVERLDELSEQLRRKLRRRIPRAALVRALVQLHMAAADEDRRQLDDILGADPVRRGRERVRRERPGGTTVALLQQRGRDLNEDATSIRPTR